MACKDPDGLDEERAVKGETESIGLCGLCSHHALVRGDRESNFHLCRKSKTDASFPKYPRLPVTQCAGFEPIASDTDSLPQDNSIDS